VVVASWINERDSTVVVKSVVMWVEVQV